MGLTRHRAAVGTFVLALALGLAALLLYRHENEAASRGFGVVTETGIDLYGGQGDANHRGSLTVAAVASATAITGFVLKRDRN